MSRTHPHAPPADPRGTEVSLHELGATLWGSRWLVLGVTVAVVALTGLVTFLMRPVYESEAVLRIRSEETAGGLLATLAPLGQLGLPGLGDAQVSTEMGVLRSRRITAPVADSFDLHLELQAPRRPRRLVLHTPQVGADAPPGIYTLRRRDDDSYSVSARRTRRPVPLPDRVEIGEPFRIGTMTLALAPELRSAPPEEIRFRVRPFYQVLEKLQKRLKVNRQEGGSNLIEVAYRDADPWVAAAVVNTMVRDYVTYTRRTTKSEARTTMDVLQDQVATYSRDLYLAEERLRVFQERQRIIAPEEQATQQVRRIAEVQVAHDAAQVEREALADLLAQVGQKARSGAPGETPYRQLATFPSFIANQGIQDILQALIELENERAELLVVRTETNADVRGITDRITQLEGQLFRLGSNYLESLDTQIAASGAALARFGRELETIPAQEIQYARLVRDQKLLGEIYLMLQTRLKEVEVQDAIDPDAVRVIDMGLIPDEDDPVFPKPLVNLALALVLGLMLGTATVVGREMANTKVRSQADAEGATAGIPVLGVIPSIRVRANGSNGRRSIRIPRIAPRAPQRPLEEALVVRSDPWNSASEAYRALLTGLTLSGQEQMPQVVSITSARSGDGKSTVAANLAVTLAQQGIRALLVDADIRHGRLHRVFGVAQGPGLIDVLRGGVSAADAAHALDLGASGTALHLLTAGERPQHPGKLMTAERLRPLLEELRREYEVVLLDAPPLNLVADAAVLGTIADTTLLVARHGVTERTALEQAASTLRRAGISVGGVVLNEFAGADPAEVGPAETGTEWAATR